MIMKAVKKRPEPTAPIQTAMTRTCTIDNFNRRFFSIYFIQYLPRLKF
jgi:hypothetical protein